ncbi:MAG: helix-turn-helix domain-containing protein, partial [Ktedonobacteraceae bacterium]|nr:helix-turn-helix domain-containing protein [Ktedonobacteraceae bacterium]
MAKSNPNKKTVVPNHRLKIAREQRGWTHKDVADLIQLPDSHTVSRWERGISFPQPHYRRELCRIFEQSAEELGLLKQTTPEQIAPPVPNSQPGSLWKVPSSFTSFVGREHEVTTICSLLDRSDVRLVTLLGPGGVGKTRLSIQIAAQMQDHFVDGICFVSLATVRDPLLMAPTIAKALGIQENTA